MEDWVEEAYKKSGLDYTRNRINGYGVDFQTEETALEVKHWGCRLTKFRYLQEVKTRFQKSDPNHEKLRVLVTTAKLGKGMRELLKQDRIILIQLPHDTNLNPSNRIKRRFLRILIKKLRILSRRVYRLLSGVELESDSVEIEATYVEKIIVIRELLGLFRGEDYGKCSEVLPNSRPPGGGNYASAYSISELGGGTMRPQIGVRNYLPHLFIYYQHNH